MNGSLSGIFLLDAGNELRFFGELESSSGNESDNDGEFVNLYHRNKMDTLRNFETCLPLVFRKCCQDSNIDFLVQFLDEHEKLITELYDFTLARPLKVESEEHFDKIIAGKSLALVLILYGFDGFNINI